MEIGKLPMAIVGITIAVIVCAVVLIPVVQESTTTHTTFTNDGLINYKFFEATDEYSFELTDGVLSVNGETITQPSAVVGNFTYTMVGSDNWLLRYANNNGSPIIQAVGIKKDGTQANSNVVAGEISDGDFVVTTTLNNTITFGFEKLYAMVKNPDEAVLKESTSSSYILGNSEIFIAGLTTISAWYNMIFITGTYDDGITITSPNLDGVTFDNIQWVIEPVSDYIDLYKLTAIKFDATYNDTVTHCTYNFFDVPSSVVAEKSVHLDQTSIQLINVIPILVIIGIVMLAVGTMIYYRR